MRKKVKSRITAQHFEAHAMRSELDRIRKHLNRDESVVNPPHYRAPRPGLEPWEIIEAYGLGFHLGNVIKYVLRAERKGHLEDIRKARRYLDRFIEINEEKAK